MPQQDAEPLLAPGAHKLDLDQLEGLTVRGFPTSHRRRSLFSALRKLSGLLSSEGTLCELWVDGSFVTEKAEPGDIDLTIMMEEFVFNGLSERLQLFIVGLVHKQDPLSASLDCYLASPSDAPAATYWRNFWSTGRDSRPKGFAVIALGSGNV